MFRLHGAQGLQPRFISSNRFQRGPERLNNHHMVFTEDPAGVMSNTWQFMANAKHDATEGEYRFSHDRPFEAEDVWIAYGLPYPQSRLERSMMRWRDAEAIRPTPSAVSKQARRDHGNEGFAIGQSPGGVDELGRQFESRPLYGLRIGDGLKRVVLMAGVHPNEGPANFLLEGLVDWIVGDTAEAAELRRCATIDVYPLVNPDGRVAGLNRTTLARKDCDANRVWRSDLYEDVLEVHAVAEAVREDLRDSPEGAPDYFIDFHAWPGAANPFGILSLHDGFAEDSFWRTLRRLEPRLGEKDTGWEHPSTETWAYQTLNARFCMTLETCFDRRWNIADWYRLGAQVGMAFHEAITLRP